METAEGRWLEIFAAISPELKPIVDVFNPQVPKHAPCPVHGGKDGFRFFRDVDERGAGICNTCGAKKNGFELLTWIELAKRNLLGRNGRAIDGRTYYTVMEEVTSKVAAYLNHGSVDFSSLRGRLGEKTRKKEEQEAYDYIKFAKRKRFASEFWAKAEYVPDVIRSYYRNRGITTPDYQLSKVVRLMPSMPFVTEARTQYLPCLVSPVVFPHKPNIAVAFNRTYVRQSLTGSLRVLGTDPTTGEKYNAKKIYNFLDDYMGASVPLYDRAPGDPPVWVVGEGIETMEAVRNLTNLPMNAALVKDMLANVLAPDWAETILIAADHDFKPRGMNAGLIAAEKAKARFRAEGRKVEILLPDDFAIQPGKLTFDWEDAYVNHYEQALRTWAPWANRVVAGPDEIAI